MYTMTSLDIPGHEGRGVPNSFMRQEQQTRHLAVIYPGVGYNASMPLLYYPARLLTNQGADVLRVEYDYTRPEFAALPASERDRIFTADVSAAWRAGLAQRSYERVTLIGKSLGTLALGYLVATVADLPPLHSLWLTPLLRDERLRAQMMRIRHPALIVAGTADSLYDAAALAEVQQATGAEAMAIEGANHSLELAGDVVESIRVLERIMRAVQAFTAQAAPSYPATDRGTIPAT